MYIEYNGPHSVYLYIFLYIIILFSALNISSRSISYDLCSVVIWDKTILFKAFIYIYTQTQRERARERERERKL